MERVTTGVPGLDTILRGGLLRGGIYMVMGRPGSGKTTLGNQVCFHHTRSGGRAVYATLLTESHGRMLALLETFSFFDRSVVGASLHYVSAYGELERAGLGGLLEVLRTTLRKTQASLLVLDGVPTAGAVAPSDLELKKFIHELQVVVELVGATCILLTGTNHPDAHYAERTMVDGLILLATTAVDLRSIRELEVVKHRGSEQLTGRHVYRINHDGVVVHPRTEALGLIPRREPTDPSRRLSLGVAGLDAVLGGGLRAGSVTLLKGPAGVGKTLIGLSFLVGGDADERGLYFGLHECPARLAQKAVGVGLPLGAALEEGRVTALWRPEAEELADAHAEALLEALRRSGARRLVIDGLGSLMSTLVYPARAAQFFGTLFHALRGMDVAVVLTMEARDIASEEPPLPVSGVSALVDNIVHLRLVEVGSQTHRLLCVTKIGQDPHDAALRELTITPRGVHVDATPERASAILQGVLRTSAPDVVSTPTGEAAPPG
ncbi:MAG: recombinase RecA [Planctomycetes bacterium]|nr:recombinase RecA [Planctomycetota bacterium]